MADQRVNVKVTTQGAGKAKTELKGVEGAISKMGKAVGIASAAYFGARGLISGFSSVIELAGIQEQAEKKLEVALGKRSKALLNQASALQQLTTFGDEAIIGVQSSIAAFLDSEDQIKKATVATLDMAVAMGMDLKSAGDLVAKTLGSSTNAMSRYGIEVTGAVGSTERLESLTQNVAELFGGQASAQADTMAGSIEQMKNAVGDAGEALGSLFGPAVINIAQLLKLGAEAAYDFFSAVDQVFSVDPGELEAIDQIQMFQAQIDNLMKTGNVEEVEGLFGKVLIGDGRFVKRIEELQGYISDIRAEINKMPDKPVVVIDPAQEDILGNVKIDMDEMNVLMSEAFNIGTKTEEQKKKQLQLDLKSAALSGQSAIQAMKSVVRAETMEAVAGYLSSVLKTVPFPYSLILAAGGGGLVAGLMDKALSSIPNKFATGADFVTSGPTPMLVGESGQERVQVTPLQGPNMNGPQGVTVNISGGVVDDSYVQNTLLPAINKATSLSPG